MNKRLGDEDSLRLIKMRLDGATWDQISTEFGKTKKAVQQIYYNRKRPNKKAKPGPKKKLIVASNIGAPVAPVTKPMIALIGTPTEVTTAIKEMFS